MIVVESEHRLAIITFSTHVTRHGALSSFAKEGPECTGYVQRLCQIRSRGLGSSRVPQHYRILISSASIITIENLSRMTAESALIRIMKAIDHIYNTRHSVFAIYYKFGREVSALDEPLSNCKTSSLIMRSSLLFI